MVFFRESIVYNRLKSWGYVCLLTGYVSIKLSPSLQNTIVRCLPLLLTTMLGVCLTSSEAHSPSPPSAPHITRKPSIIAGRQPFNRIQHPKKRAFLAAYAACGQIGVAAQTAGIHRTSHFYWQEDPDYVAAFAEAHQMAISLHEDEASRRALGWDETRYTDDGTSYTIHKYSDVMLIFRLKALAPEKYRDNAKPDDRTDISALLRTVLLELADRREARDVTHEADWAPLPPAQRNGKPSNAQTALPPPPDSNEDA